ncbi:MAG: hypothetical protein MZV63_72060 [Marinilabiliales bacterium]|nr:hypothetical protein [Marinilabiliales bacterium]
MTSLASMFRERPVNVNVMASTITMHGILDVIVNVGRDINIDGRFSSRRHVLEQVFREGDAAADLFIQDGLLESRARFRTSWKLMPSSSSISAASAEEDGAYNPTSMISSTVSRHWRNTRQCMPPMP